MSAIRETRGYRGFANRAEFNDHKRKRNAEEAVMERLGIAERERRRQDAARFASLPSLDRIERRHGKAERDRIAALNLPQHQSAYADAAE